MKSRESILDAIRRHKPDPLPAPDYIAAAPDFPLEERFAGELELAGGALVRLDSTEDPAETIGRHYHPAHSWSSIDGITLPNPIEPDSVGRDKLEQLELVLLEGSIGVAENGAVWISGMQLPGRVLPFITLDLAILLKSNALVGTMHEAYERIETCPSGFGVFICGPSKTADIEQSLVMGAHGPRSTTIYLAESR